jgi:hypothetical protein
MKSELLTFPKGSKSHSKRKKYMLQTMEIWWEIGDTTYRLHKHKTNSGHFMSLFKRRTASTFASEIWGLQTRHWPQIKAKERHLV